ncbi:aspartate/tyrosine/aromatic aminotransferase [Verrucomicrobiaceae bacterium N1E253]|uniref:Aspartate/tyrosine/aromatic aminotransferase n=1 Tax=Oceaniferula marina TaxID=2748318 RepID=A0A851GPI0_9BACT|nr:amino acid aminotransferase [Oceaniferula marina]NWK56927.1 aspartate/tyrosine/aromatic aminotransferase [Oceaniferula marina]
MFENIPQAAPDPILGLTEVYNADPNPEKINLGVGIYQDEQGKTPVLTSVKRAEDLILKQEQSKSYLPIPGSPDYAKAVQTLLFGEDSALRSEGRLFTAHTPGGTGALRVAGEFLKTKTDADTVWLTVPTWPNHGPIFQAAGMKVETFAWFNAETHSFDADAALAAIEQIPEGDVIVLHGCCHNPTGCDPTAEQWRQIAEAVSRRGLMPVMDFAYQGFATGIEEDAVGLRIVAEVCPELIICSSFSKNFGLYRERTGAVTFVTKDADTQGRLASQAKLVVRTNYSNPPSHGGSIVATIFSDQELIAQWHEDLKEMRERLNGMRSLLVSNMASLQSARDFSFVEQQRGMFSMLGLSKEQVAEMGEKHSIHMVGSSRINLAGLSTSNIERFCQALASVL